MNTAARRLPPLDPNLAQGMADADLKRRVDYLRRRLAEGALCGSMRRMTKLELREAERALEAREKSHAA
jgi:hypothetical protein